MSTTFYHILTWVYAAAMIYVLVYYHRAGAAANYLGPDDPDIIPIDVSGRAGRLMLLLWGHYTLTVTILSIFELVVGR